jgi:ankyrin repeat protein
MIKQFKTYFESKSINPRNCKGETPLIIAIKKGNLELVKLFLENGMDYTIPIFSYSEIFNGRKTSIEIAMENDQIEIVHEILNKFFNDLYFKKFNLVDRKIFPFLFYLIEFNNEDIIKFILNKFIEELSQNNFDLNNKSIFELLIKTSMELNDENIIKSISNIFEKDLTESKFYLQNI